MEFKGIDVSKWQGLINWDEVRKDGTEFAILREGWGKNLLLRLIKSLKKTMRTRKLWEFP